MGTRTKNQIVLKKQKCGGFLFKIFEHESLIRSTIVALAGNGKILAKGGKYSTTDELCRNVAKSANAHSNYRQPAFCQYIVS